MTRDVPSAYPAYMRPLSRANALRAAEAHVRAATDDVTRAAETWFDARAGNASADRSARLLLAVAVVRLKRARDEHAHCLACYFTVPSDNT